MSLFVRESKHINHSTNGGQRDGRKTQKRVCNTVKNRLVDLETFIDRMDVNQRDPMDGYVTVQWWHNQILR